jgi:hypothetical protein
MDKTTICKCGHDKWSHAIDLKGNIGACQKEICKDWEWCDCQKFEPIEEQSKSDK